MKRCFAALLVSLATTNVGLAQLQDSILIQLTTGKTEYRNVPLCIPISVSQEWGKFVEVPVVDFQPGSGAAGNEMGQLTRPGILTESIPPAKPGLVRRDLHVVLPVIRGKWSLLVTFKKTDLQSPLFAWTEKKNMYEELVLTGSGPATPVLRYMNRPYDASSKESRERSYKVFHHLYDPTGKRFVTNGGFADDSAGKGKKLLYPHHRGIMYGFNKCSYGPDLKNKADTWHCTGATHVSHEKTLNREAGPVVGRQRVLLGWYGAGEKPFALEEREMTVYNVKGGTLVEFASRLKTTGGKIRVDGDPQHAGFQFRAHNDVAAQTQQQTYYLHPDGAKGAMGKERNWPGDKSMVDLPWYAMSFVLDKQRYSAVYLNHPKNPKETRFSERAYGRFGGYFQRDITPEDPLVVTYRLWLQNGEITTEQARALQTAFATPPKANVK
ncbi:MAG: PmoA family protein [Planctomycetes bacterium]|nr:PmoA family protein [Planctomycetota bacterium]